MPAHCPLPTATGVAVAIAPARPCPPLSQDMTLRVSDPLVEGQTFYFYHVKWKEEVPPGKRV